MIITVLIALCFFFFKPGIPSLKSWFSSFLIYKIVLLSFLWVFPQIQPPFSSLYLHHIEILPYTQLALSWGVTAHICFTISEHVFTFQLGSSFHFFLAAQDLPHPLIPHLSSLLQTLSHMYTSHLQNKPILQPASLTAVSLLYFTAKLLEIHNHWHFLPFHLYFSIMQYGFFYHSTESSLRRSLTVF